ncbi:heme-copper oxidase subunit III [Olleya aquimaris]|uniref:Cytochrome c oxidase subunit 3 n=1 Tax=Olleya sediminilitoris TaxID=2795739 RepID=A0ABS1WLZ8_9FLAO|nr:cytochrome c oxidase subunit 3 [Olleya sediminilitoris]AXO80350.1 heme-copper oxidase subunit III [Olleya aquimaris]MBL7560130.1 cytochrome c oxidase subunit 3 [Olleya sediminilitoris]
MDLTQGTLEEKTGRARKMMLYFGIASLIMSFAGWTSAFIVSSSRPDWLQNFQMPQPFWISIIIMIISSITFMVAKKALKQGNTKLTTAMLVVTFVLGLTFIYNQFVGFNQIIGEGYNFTGPTSNITVTYIYLIAVVHIVHVVIGLVPVLVLLINHLRGKYSEKNIVGFELAETFWHFVDLLWLYLFFFLYFFLN